MSRWTGGLALAAALMILIAPGTAGAKPRLRSSYGVVAPGTLYVTATVRGAPRSARALLEVKGSGRRRTVRDQRRLRRGAAKLRWSLPKGARSITMRVRVVRKGRRARAVAVGPWRRVALAAVRRSAPVTPVAPRSVVSAPTPGQPGQLVLSRAQSVERGDVIATGTGPATPEGMLVKAVSVSRAGGQTVVATEPATLPDAVPVGELDVELPGEAAARVSASPLRRLAQSLECTNGRSAEAVGEASLSAGLSLTTKWAKARRLALPKLTARFSGDVRANLRATAGISGEAKCVMDRQPLFATPVRLATFATSIGPVPVTGVVNGQIYLSGGAEAKGEIRASMTASAGASAGVEYDGQSFKPFGKLDKSFDVQPPTVLASGSASASIAPAIDVRFYGLAGPEIDYSAGLKLAADIDPAPGEPWWKVTAPLDLGVKLRLHAWTLNLESPRFTVWSEEPELLRATTPAGGSSVTDLGPSPSPLPEGVRTRLVWDSNTDVDLHTWDQDGFHAYFNDRFGIDSGYLDQDVIPGFGPETFQETDPGHVFTFGVCQYSGEQANVTVDVRDPDGQTRRFMVTLRGRKAASLLTVSPGGADGYVPDGGWCDDGGGDPTDLGQTSTGTFGD